jgi:hypothetical protein
MTKNILLHELRSKFEDAGFVDSDSLIANVNTSIPAGAIVMNNSYGLMAAIEVETSTKELSNSLVKHKEIMHDYLREVLIYLENTKGLIVDGYLLLILTEVPNEESQEEIRSIESDTQICRKHVVWPKTNLNELDRLEFVTVLSLPDSPSNIPISKESFELSPKAKSLIDYYAGHKLDDVLDFIKKGGLKQC